MKKLIIGLIAIVLVFFAFKLMNKSGKGVAHRNIVIDGSSTVFPISEAVAEEFQKKNPQVRVSVGTSGTGGGIKKFLLGEVDIANASRTLSESEIAAAEKANLKYVELKIARDGLAVVVSNKNTFLQTLTIEQLKRIWEPGSILNNWNELDPSFPNQKIKLYGPGADSGTFDYFTEAVVGKAKSSRSDYNASEDDNVLVNGVAGEEFSLGYFGISYLVANTDKIRALAIAKEPASPVSPSQESVSNGSYPLSRPLFIYLSNKAAQDENVRSFINFMLETSSKYAAEVGYVPLSESETIEELAKWNAFAQ